MLTRSCLGHARQGSRCLLRPLRQYRPRRRYSSTTHVAPSAAETKSAVAALNSLSNELDKLSPRFDISASQIRIIQSPSDFYETLKTKILQAKSRIYLSTLYIGKTEHELIDTIRQALRSNPSLQVSILTDYLRGTRETPTPSCATLLASLVQEFGPTRVEIRMYHTPNLTGLRKAVLPKRINEGWGLQHMKLYGVDDELIMSGANLSNDYFTNRQDRYHLFSSAEMTNYFNRMYKTVCSLSYQVVPDGAAPGGFRMEWPDSNAQPQPLEDPKGYIETATKLLEALLKPSLLVNSSTQTDTQVYPLSQLTPIMKPDTSTELPAISLILRRLSEPAFARSSWTFTAGYFNMTPDMRTLLLATNPARGTVISASPWANGFYGSKGVSGMLPPAYTYLSRRFLQAVGTAGLGQQIALKEWRRGTVNEPEGWTYHAKGLWITLPGEQNPSISVVGSSNYTKRSYSLDLETNTLIVTRNPELMKRLGEEETWLQDYAKQVDSREFEKTERRVGLHVRIAMWIVTLVGGAL